VAKMEKMKLAIATTFLLFLTTAANAVDPDAAVKAHLQCVADKVAKFDDGKSSNSELAGRVIPLCHSLHVAAMQATGGDPNNSDLEQAHTAAAVEMARIHSGHRQ